MLKIWKQSWKKEDGAGQDSGQDDQSRGPDDDMDNTPSLSPAAPPVFEHDSDGPVSSRALKRAVSSSSRSNYSPNDLEPAEDMTLERPTKRRRTEASVKAPPPLDAISKLLPEVMDVDEEPSLMDRVLNTPHTDIDTIAEEAKQGNILALFESETQKVTVFCALLTWACGVERERPNTGVVRRRRAALVVVDDVATATVHASQIAEVTKLSVGVFASALHSSPLNHWLELMCKDVILISANHFLESLSSGAVAISSIYFMIIDDFMTLKDNNIHPVRQIMQDFYRITDKLSRPKLFGGHFVPSDASFVLDTSLLKVEEILDARLSGITNAMRESLLSLPDKPMELVIFYDPQVKLIETALQKRLRMHDSRMSIYRNHHRNAKHALAEIGSCACDLVWRRALKDIEVELGNDEPVYEEEDELQAGSETAIKKAKSNIRDAIKNWLFAMPNLDSSSRGFNVTPKFAKLVQILKACEPQGDGFRGIIFVHKRSIAYIIADLLRTLDDRVGFLRPQTLAGHGPSSETLTQDDILEGFRSGLYNLLVVTKYAEDLDLALATLVVRFDLFDSQVSYALSRSRARGQECHFVHMAERGSDVHRRILSRIATQDVRFERWVQRVTRSPGSAIPPLPLRETIDPYRSDSDDEDDDPSKFVMDPTTSGRIYEQDAITVVYRFVSQLDSLLREADSLKEPLFEYEELQGGSLGKSSFICTVLLPTVSPTTRVSGSPCSSIELARRSACFQTCVELFQRGVLDYRLFPRPRLPTTRPQRPAYISVQTMDALTDQEDDEDELPSKSKQGQSKSTGAREYPRKHPDFWRNSLPIMRNCLYPTIITPVVDPAVIKEHCGPYAPLLLLTRLPLPPLHSFKLFFSGLAGKIVLTRAAPIESEEERLQDLYRYTTRLIRYITNKPLVCPLEQMVYFFAPLSYRTGSAFSQERQSSVNTWDFPIVDDLVLWETVKLAAERPAVSLNTQDLRTLTEDTEDAIIQDRWVEFTRRYFCVRMRPDLTPLSKPEDSPREKDYENLAEYCRAKRRNGFDGLQNYKQPIIEVQRCPQIISNLNPASKPLPNNDVRHPAKYLIPELCAKCTVPASVYRTTCLIPSIMRRIDDLLLIKELNAKFFDHMISEQHLHEAVSSPSAAIEYDYERLELLGDAYLKYLSSIYLFVTFPSTPEGALHILRQKIISNRSLLRNANRCGLPQYIQSKTFTLKSWSPPGFHLYQKKRKDESQAEGSVQTLEDGELPSHFKAPVEQENVGEDARVDGRSKLNEHGEPSGITSAPNKPPAQKMGKRRRQENEGNVQWIGDKGVADVAEAIIGAAYITGGREVALKVTKALNIPVPHIDRWADFGRKVLAPPPEVTAKLGPGSIEAVEAIIGHKFNHTHLLAQALTHASIHGNDMTSYERLEFIGDAILDFLVIRHIYDRDSGLSPGALTLLKSAMVSNSALAAVCVWAGLHDHLLFESYSLANSISQYADELKARETEENELARKEQRPLGQYWADVEPPKALSDVVESILGAIYVSDNFSPVGAEIFFDKVLKPFYDRHITLQTLSHHPTKILFELFQSQGCQEFEIIKRAIPPDENNHTVECSIIVHDIVLSIARDIATNAAARRASFFALDAIEGDPDFLTRTCDCRAVIQARKAAKKANKAATCNIDEAEEQIVEDALGSDNGF